MKAAVTALIAAIEAAAVALAVFALIGVPAILVWWRGFDFEAEPSDVAALVSGLWQLVHLVPMQLTVPAQTALGLGLPPESFHFAVSLAPLGLTIVTATLAALSGWRFAGRGAAGAWALPGAFIGFALAAWFTGAAADEYGAQATWQRILLPLAVYAVPMVFGYVLRSAREGADWWFSFVRGVQRLFARVAPLASSALPERATEVLRLTGAAVVSLVGLGALGVAVAIPSGYIEIVRLSQGLYLDFWGSLMLFFVQLTLLPIAWAWAISWFVGTGFAIGQATSVTPFETLLGPLPGLPLFGAIPEGWGWAGGLAPVIIVAIGGALGGLAAGRPAVRRGSALVTLLIPLCAAALTGLVIVLIAVLSSGAIGPARLSESGPSPWATGGFVALELAFGMTLGVFARRVDLVTLREEPEWVSKLTRTETRTFGSDDGIPDGGASADGVSVERVPTDRVPVDGAPVERVPLVRAPADGTPVGGTRAGLWYSSALGAGRGSREAKREGSREDRREGSREGKRDGSREGKRDGSRGGKREDRPEGSPETPETADVADVSFAWDIGPATPRGGEESDLPTEELTVVSRSAALRDRLKKKLRRK